MKIKVKHGDQVLEIEHTALELPEGAQLVEPGKIPDGFVTTDYMNGEIRRRLAGKVQKEELVDDDDFFKQAAQKRGIQLGDDGKPVKAKDVDVEKLYADWQREHVDPLKQQAEKLKGFNDSLLSQTKRAAIVQAAEKAGVKKQFRIAPTKDVPSAVEAMFDARFAYDPETGSFAEVEKMEGDKPVFRYSPNPQERRYAGPEDFFGSLKKNADFKEWFEDNRPGNSGFDRPGPGGDKVLGRAAFEALAPDARAAHIKGGGTVAD